MSIEKIICIKVMMKVITYAANEIAKFNEDYRKKLEGLSDIIEWKVGKDLNFYTEIKDGKISSGEGIKQNPTLTFEINDLDLALKLLTGRENFENLGEKAKIIGDEKKREKFSFILDTIKEYLGDLTT
ncbi:MAG: hypothetical protein ACP6IY_03425 [Promethearchaeia archaeon]